MMKKSTFSRLMFGLVVMLFSAISSIDSFAQVTSSSISGFVKDDKGEALPGATVVAIHVPTGTKYGTVTNIDGRYNFPTVRVGGPYKITTSFVGSKDQLVEGVNASLGTAANVDFKMSDNTQQLDEVVVRSNRGDVMSSERTGAATTINSSQLKSLPTLSRSLSDFTRLTPQANGSSFAGTNNRYNNITIDGSVNNDVFGLSGSGTPGGTAGTQPISLDAIQEIQVVLAPYDVSLGNFTGAGVNAVTRSGNNNIEGSVYYFNRNQNTIGKSVITGLKSTKFSDSQFGFRLGGPLVKNKLFYFVNYEQGNRSVPTAYNTGDTGAAIKAETAQAIADFTKTKWGYDVGSASLLNLETKNTKILAKIDWNVNQKNQFSVRYNHITATNENLTRSGTVFQFSNTGYTINNKQDIVVAELRSTLSNKLSNNIIVSYSRIRDYRTTLGVDFPQITIRSIDGNSAASAVLGGETSSYGNLLDQDIIELTDNLKMNVGKHLFTFGTHNEFFTFRNGFTNNYNGAWVFATLEDYKNNIPASVAVAYSKTSDKLPTAKFSAAQLGFYAQDDFEAAKGLKLTVGLRLDIPVMADKPADNTQFAKDFPGYSTTNTPTGQLLWSPRLGFNYDVKGDRSVQLRGGVGIFTGRVPFVWLSNQFTNNGLLLGSVSASGTKNINGGKGFEPSVDNQKNVGTTVATTQINVTTSNFKIPQVLRFNLAADFKLPGGIIATLEGIYSKTLNNVAYQDINRKASVATIDPVLSGGTSTTAGADSRPLYTNNVAAGKVNASYTNVLLLSNTNKGYNYTVTGQLQKRFTNGLNAMVAYTYGQARSINDGMSSTALSNWRFVYTYTDMNNPLLATSFYQLKNRVVASLGYVFSYGANKASKTGINFFYSGQSGGLFSYIYNGDLNRDDNGTTFADLIFVPKDASQIHLLDIKNSSGVVTSTAAQQWTALDAFINNDPYLKTRRGQYAERNGGRTPWINQIDMRISQDLGITVAGKRHAIQVTADVFNLGNLLKNSWGRQYVISNQSFQLLSYDATNKGFTFTSPNKHAWDNSISDLASRWQMQLGLRYIFE